VRFTHFVFNCSVLLGKRAGTGDARYKCMNLRCSENQILAMTLVEAIVVIGVIGLVVLMLLPTVCGPTRRVLANTCSNNLKQLATAMKVWEGDNNDKFPMGLSVTNGGTKELMETTEAWRVFQVMSNEISTPKILFCPQDSTRTNFARDFGEDLKNKISYFIGMVADDSDPQSLLSGDDNFLLKNLPVSNGNLNIFSNSAIDWDSSRHFSRIKQDWFTTTRTNYGYLMLADGSVQASTDSGLKIYIQQSNVVTNRFAIP
jgi:type II secretory pathway pseudopilin PulG